MQAYNTYIKIQGNQLYNCNSLGGALGSINIYWAKHISITDNTVADPASASCLNITDFVDAHIANNVFSTTVNQFCRGIVCNTGTSYSSRSFATTWSDLFIHNNRFMLNNASNNEAVYLPVNSTITISRLSCIGNVANCSGGYLTFDYITTLKVYNNIAMGSSTTITTGTHSTSVTSGNNN